MRYKDRIKRVCQQGRKLKIIRIYIKIILISYIYIRLIQKKVKMFENNFL